MPPRPHSAEPGRLPPGVAIRLELGDLLLRRPLPEDADAVHAVHADPRVWAHHPVGRHSDLGQTRRFLEDVDRHWEARDLGPWAMVAGDAGVIGLGGLRLHELGGEPALNAYYRVAPRMQGRGYATRTLAAGLELIAPALGLPVVVRTRPDNAAAACVALKLGLVDAGWEELDGRRLRVLHTP